MTPKASDRSPRSAGPCSALPLCLDPTAEEAVDVEAHLHQCPECRRARALLEMARAELAAFPPALSEDARGRLWQGVARPTLAGWGRRPPWTVWAALALTAAVAVVVLAVPWPVERKPAPALTGGGTGHELAGTKRLRSSEGVNVGEGRITALRPSTLRSVAAGESARVELEDGAIEVDVRPLAPGATFTLVTAQAEIQVVGTKFRVAAASTSTLVEVERGTVKVTPLAAPAPASLLRAGEQLLVGAGDRPAASSASRRDAREPPAAPAAPAASASQGQSLEAARALLPVDAARATELAQEVLAAPSAPSIEVEALAVVADGLRRSGEYAAAADYYARVARHPAGEAFAEEALMRRALLLADNLEDFVGALAALREAEERFPGGVLEPERETLAREVRAAIGAVEPKPDEGIPAIRQPIPVDHP